MVRKNRPNVLFIVTDQQFSDAIGCESPDLETPNIDRLAASGFRFKRAYCAQPVCGPSRASLWTGKMPHDHGATANGVSLAASFVEQSLGVILKNGGYRCAYGGKWHVPSSSITDGFGFSRICGMDDTRLADRCVEFLSQQHNRVEPFFLVASFDNPHNICEWARAQPLPWGDVPEVPIQDCPNVPANYCEPPNFPDLLEITRAALPPVHPTKNWSADDWRRYRHAYYRLCEKVDAEIGKILDALRANGLAHDTLVVFTSDHGDGLGAHRWNQKMALFEECIRIPLIACWPGTIASGVVDDTHLVSNGLDLFPTFCDYAGILPPDGLEGRSLRPILESRGGDGWRQKMVVETLWNPNRWHGLNAMGRALLTDRYKYSVYSWGRHREQLVDLRSDEGEMVNLAVESRYEGILEQYRRDLSSWCRETQDDTFLRYLDL